MERRDLHSVVAAITMEGDAIPTAVGQCCPAPERTVFLPRAGKFSCTGKEWWDDGCPKSGNVGVGKSEG
ncbi:MAG: hypothetical protein K2H04_07660 [Bacteroidaceae bacterium]|nr:hypothetical protein [Bacteroidaceae bacterium]